MSRLKQTLGLAGLLVALVGIALDRRWVIWIAIGLLAASLAVRLLLRRQERSAAATASGEGPDPV